MLTVNQNRFVSYQNLAKRAQTIVHYPKLFDNICLDKLNKHKNSMPLCLAVGILKLTGTLMNLNYNPIGTSAYVFLEKGRIQTRNRKTGKKEKFLIEKGSLLIFGSFFRENYTYEIKSDYVEFFQVNPLSYIYLSPNERLKYATKIRRLLQPTTSKPLWKQCGQKNLVISEELGKGSYGFVNLGEIQQNRFAIKTTTLKPEAVENPYSRHVSAWHETLILTELFKPLIERNDCPNLPLIYNAMTCKKGDKHNLTTFVELGSGDLKHYFYEENPTTEELYSALFQIMAGLHAIQLNGQIMNFDVKKQNILYYRVDPGGYWQYNIRGKNYYVPNYGFMFILNDFGISRPMSPNFVLYKSMKSKTFRLGSRYAMVIDNKFVPIVAENKTDSEGKLVEPDMVEWRQDGKKFMTTGAEFRIDKKTNSVIPIKIKLSHAQRKFLKKNNIAQDPTKKDFFLHPEIIPPFEFYNDTQDVIRMFIGGKRSTQRGYHRAYEGLSKEFAKQLKSMAGISDSVRIKERDEDREKEGLQSGIFSLNPSHVLAGHFIEEFFGKMEKFMERPNKKSMKLASYELK